MQQHRAAVTAAEPLLMLNNISTLILAVSAAVQQ
jgi:hypothetical protein